MVAGHRRDKQKFLLRLGSCGLKLLFEMEQFAKRPLPNHSLDDWNGAAINCRGCEAKRGLVIAARQSLEKLCRSGEISPSSGIGDRIDGVLEPRPRGIGQGPYRSQGDMSEFMHFIRERRHPRSPFPVAPAHCPYMLPIHSPAASRPHPGFPGQNYPLPLATSTTWAGIATGKMRPGASGSFVWTKF